MRFRPLSEALLTAYSGGTLARMGGPTSMPSNPVRSACSASVFDDHFGARALVNLLQRCCSTAL
jgi:hypothetical protein